MTSWSYDANSRVAGQALANGVQVSSSYDKADRLLLLANLGTGGATLSSFAYTYDSVHNRTQVVEVDGSVVTWTYDPTYQLTNEQRSGPNSYDITYAYDAVGNRTLLVNNGSPTTYVYNSANGIATSQSSSGVSTYTFDGDGNLLTSLAPGGLSTTNTWDGENRLTRVALPTGIVDTFTYNGDGQRVQKVDSAGTTNYVWDGRNAILETDGGIAVQVLYTVEPFLRGNLISQSRLGSDSFFQFDAPASTRQLTNIVGSVTDDYVYDSFGGITVNGTTTNSFLFVGRVEWYHDSDLTLYHDAGFGYFDPLLGRLLARQNVIVGTNAYLLLANNSVRHPAGWENPPPTGTVPDDIAIDVPNECTFECSGYTSGPTRPGGKIYVWQNPDFILKNCKCLSDGWCLRITVGGHGAGGAGACSIAYTDCYGCDSPGAVSRLFNPISKCFKAKLSRGAVVRICSCSPTNWTNFEACLKLMATTIGAKVCACYGQAYLGGDKQKGYCRCHGTWICRDP